MSDAFERLMQNASDGLFDNANAQFVAPPDVEPEEVAALFSNALGRKVLNAMYRAFVDVSIVEPGQSPEVHGIRQGQANVVFWIAAKIEAAEGGPEDGQEG